MMKVRNAEEIAALYDHDYLAWIEATTECLQQRDYSNIDWENLMEEIASLGRDDKRRLETDLVVVLWHLLKWQYKPDHRNCTWELNIVEHRRRILENLETSPSLKAFMVRELPESYVDSVGQASIETGLPKDKFPTNCPYTVEQILDEDFLPEVAV
ncbi:MAG: DUF29 domain-containing protein [Cyanobacteria bacterium J06634_6]